MSPVLVTLHEAHREAKAQGIRKLLPLLEVPLVREEILTPESTTSTIELTHRFVQLGEQLFVHLLLILKRRIERLVQRSFRGVIERDIPVRVGRQLEDVRPPDPGLAKFRVDILSVFLGLLQEVNGVLKVHEGIVPYAIPEALSRVLGPTASSPVVLISGPPELARRRPVLDGRPGKPVIRPVHERPVSRRLKLDLREQEPRIELSGLGGIFIGVPEIRYRIAGEEHPGEQKENDEFRNT